MHRLQAAAAFLLLALIVVAPVPLGSARDWAWAPLAALVGVVLLVQAVAQSERDDAHRPAVGDLLASFLAVGAATLWALAQTLPSDLFGPVNALLSSAKEALAQPSPPRIATDIEQSMTGIMRLLTYCGIFWLSTQFGRDTKFAKQLTRGLVASAVLVTVYGFIMQIDNRSCVVINVVKAPIGSSCAFSGTFRNADNYATFAALGALICVAEVYGRLLSIDSSTTSARQRLRARLGILSGGGGVLLGALIVLVGGLFLSGSKAGAPSFLGACLAMILILNGAQRRRSRAAIVSLVTLVAFALAMLAVSGEMLVTRLVALINFGDADRIALYSLSLEAIALHPWVGWGVGSFEGVFSVLQPASIKLVYTQAHNTYLESAIELGIPAACLLVLSVALPAARCALGVFQRKKDAHYPALGFGAAVLVGLHSLVDFSIQIPAIAVAFSAILGLGWAQSQSSRL